MRAADATTTGARASRAATAAPSPPHRQVLRPARYSPRLLRVGRHRKPLREAAHAQAWLRTPERSRALCCVAAAAAAAAGGDGKAAKPQKEPLGQKALTVILNTTNVPCGSYIPEPRTILHSLDARIKQVWLVALMVCLARSTVPVRIGVTLAVAALTLVVLPPRTWKQQLRPLLLLCAFLFVGTALGADGVPPVTTDRVPPAAVEGLSLDPGMLPGYSYVVAKLGPITVTRRSLNLAVSGACLTFSVIQSAALTLLTTPEESMARALAWFLAPLRLLQVPVKQIVLTLLLSLRFMSLVFEEMRNIALGLAARDIQWAQLKALGSAELVASMAGRLLSNLFAHADKIAFAMHARGFQGVEEHRIHGTQPQGSSPWVNLVAIALLALWLGSLALPTA